MKRKVQTAFSHPLVTSGSFLLMGTLFAYSLHFFFTIIMGRLMSVEDFGLFSSLISVVSFFAMIQLAVGNLFSRFSAQFHASESKALQKKLLSKGLMFSVAVGLVGALILFFLNNWLLALFKTDNISVLLLTELALIATIFLAVPYGVLQGMLKFKFITFLNIITAVSKIAVGLSLVLVGFGVVGAMGSVALSIMVPFLIALIFLLNHFKKANEKKDVKKPNAGFKRFSVQFVVATGAITLLSHGDIVFARIFLTPAESGQYAALSLMGKTIYYATQPIHTVFFPLISYQSAKEDNTLNTLKIALFIIASISIAASIFYFLFPAFIQTIFFPASSYESLRSLLGPFSVYIAVLSLVYVFHNFFLSLGKSVVYKINLLGALVFLVLGTFYHDSILSIMIVLLLSSLVMLFSYTFYFIIRRND